MRKSIPRAETGANGRSPRCDSDKYQKMLITHPERLRMSNRMVQYEARLIQRVYGKPFEDALEIAKFTLAAKMDADQRAKMRQSRLVQLRRERAADQCKRTSEPLHRTHGPPLQGGAPGLGKRR